LNKTVYAPYAMELYYLSVIYSPGTLDTARALPSPTFTPLLSGETHNTTICNVNRYNQKNTTQTSLRCCPMEELRLLLLRWTGMLLIVLSFSPGSALGQTTQEAEDRNEMQNIDRDHDKTLKLHPLHYGEIFLSYEKVRAPQLSNEFGLSYLYKGYLKGDGWTPEAKDVMGIGVRMSQRYYTSKKKLAPFGFFHGPMFGYRFVVFEENVFGLPELPPDDPDYTYVGRLYQNSLDLSYHLGGQFQMGRQFTVEISGGLGGRLKFAKATNGGGLIETAIIGHVVHADESTVVAVVPSPQLNFGIGYSF
jgi:hypothetical protein